MAWLPGLDSVCDRLRQSPVSFEQGSDSDEEGDASPWRINAYLRREFGLATPHAALSLSSLPPLPLLPPDITVATSPSPPLPPPHLLLDACGLSQMRPLQPNTDLGQLLLEYSGDEGQVCADADDDACDDFDDEPGASMLPRELRSSNLTQCGDAVDIIAPAEQHAQSAPLGSAPARLLRLFRAGLAQLWATRHSQGEAGPLGARPLPRVLEPAASKVADVTAPLITHTASD